MRTLTLGKARSDPATIAHFLAGNIGRCWRLAFRKDWIHHLVRNRFSTDLAEIIARISRYAAAADGTDADAVADELRGNFAEWLGYFLRRNYGSCRGRCADISVMPRPVCCNGPKRGGAIPCLASVGAFLRHCETTALPRIM